MWDWTSEVVRGMVARFVIRRGGRLVLGLLALSALGVSQSAHAQSPEGDPKTAVRLAKAAFEYRDFKRVVAILDPWLHPPRIVDPKLEVRARELLGVSQHVLGNVERAEEEFAQLLELAPKHELDPFLVPPPVVQSFEEVRAKMKPILDRLIDQPPKEPDPPPVEVRTQVRLVEVPHPAIVLTPFGIPQFALGEKSWGAMWAGVQALGLVMNVLGWLQADRADDLSSFRAWRGVWGTGIGVFVGGWAGSGLHAYQQLEAKRSALLAPSTEGPSVAPDPTAPSARTATWTWHF